MVLSQNMIMVLQSKLTMNGQKSHLFSSKNLEVRSNYTPRATKALKVVGVQRDQ
jgi:hypothetical protein